MWVSSGSFWIFKRWVWIAYSLQLASHVTPGTVWEVGSLLRLQILTAGKGSSRVTCEPRCSVWSGVHLETVDILFQVQHIRTWPCLRLWMFENNPGTGRRAYTGHCGQVTTGTGYEMWGQQETEHVIPVTGSGKGVSLETVDLWLQVQCLGSDITQETCDPRYRLLRVGKLWIVWSRDSTIISLHLG